MALIEEELSVVTIQELLSLNLSIPNYQRPYNWSTASTYTLWQDTYESFQENIEEYRLGSVILHKEDDTYYVVDGQQRLTTLSLLLYCLDENVNNISLLDEKFSVHSVNPIINNMELLEKKTAEIQEEQDKFKTYLLEKCTVVRIVTNNEQEAFQFFDSQNSRGKELAPHDLLKSYHLREMHEEEEELKTKIIERWENLDQQRLAALFRVYLYPLTQWYKWRDGLGYSSKNIDVFKGIKSRNTYHHAIYQKAANLFVEQMNRNGSVEILAVNTLNQFQLTQPLIAGRRFFSYTLHYAELHKKISKRMTDFHPDERQIPNKSSGDRYIRQLYESALLFFADRFGTNALTDIAMKQLYTWSYSLRLIMHAVYPETVNKYARGKHERINTGIDLIARISEMHEPEELNMIVFERVDADRVSDNIKRYTEIWELLRKENRW